MRAEVLAAMAEVQVSSINDNDKGRCQLEVSTARTEVSAGGGGVRCQ